MRRETGLGGGRIPDGPRARFDAAGELPSGIQKNRGALPLSRLGAGVPDIAMTPIATQRTALQSSVLNGRYCLTDVLGEGGMAVVYRALDYKTRRRVAVKQLRLGIPIPQGRERFERELRLMGAIEHPHCVRLLDSGRGPAPFAVLELLEGRDLRDAMSRPLPAAQVLQLTLQLLRGLQAVHAAGIIHRDIKPENIMLTRGSGGSERLVLIDFGAAIPVSTPQVRSEPLTAVGQLVGTPSAMSPEQFQGAAATIQSDLYAVGVLMYEMLAGRAPFPGTDIFEVANAKSQAAPEVPAFVPAAVAWLVRCLLSPSPEQRPESVAEAIETVLYARDVLRQTTATRTWFDLLAVTSGRRPR